MKTKVYTITLTVDADPEPLAKAIQKRFADVVIAYETRGPFEVDITDWERE